MPVGRWVSDTPMMATSIFAVGLKACHKAGSGYRLVADIEGMASVRRLPTMQANLLAVVVRRSLRVLDWYDSGRLTSEESGIGVSGGFAIIRPGVKVPYYLNMLFNTVANIVENIVP